MKPYYEDEWVTLYHGDCLELADLWTSADVLVTDPVYGMDLSSGWASDFDGLKIANDETPAVRDAAIWLWGGHKPGLAFSRVDLPVPGNKMRLIWDKGEHTGMGDLNIPWKPSYEMIDVLGAWPKRELKGRGGGGRGTPIYRVMAPTPGKRNGRRHPTEKPVPLLEALIERCPPGVIADPFAGSGSTLIAARNLGRKAIGVELEKKYCEVIVKRLQQQAFDFSALGD